MQIDLEAEEQVMSRTVVFKSVSGINCDMGVKPSPVRALEPHIDFYINVLGFALAQQDEKSAVLKRDGVQIELAAKPDHVPETSGSCYFDVSDVEALRKEFLDAGAKPGAIEVQEYGGKHFRLFFLKEDYDDYCFCFGQPA
jgi:predicted enzyme related to lactoylglutathione lyase